MVLTKKKSTKLSHTENNYLAQSSAKSHYILILVVSKQYIEWKSTHDSACTNPWGMSLWWPSLRLLCSLTHWGRDKMAAFFADDIFKCIFLNENFWISNKISLKYVPEGLIDNKPSLVLIMGCRRTGSLLMHTCNTWPQWVKSPQLILRWGACRWYAIFSWFARRTRG